MTAAPLKVRHTMIEIPMSKIAGGVRRALHPVRTLGALAFAGRALPDTTLRGVRSIRPHGGGRPGRCRPGFSSEASPPGSVVSCRKRHAGRGVDAPAIAGRVSTISAGTAPAGCRPFAPRHGSGLLTLRLRLGRSRAAPSWRRPIEDGCRGAFPAPLHAIRAAFRAGPGEEPALRRTEPPAGRVAFWSAQWQPIPSGLLRRAAARNLPPS